MLVMFEYMTVQEVAKNEDIIQDFGSDNIIFLNKEGIALWIKNYAI